MLAEGSCPDIREGKPEAAATFFRCQGYCEYVCDDCVASTEVPNGQIRDRCTECNIKKYVPLSIIKPEKFEMKSGSDPEVNQKQRHIIVKLVRK